MNIHYPGEARRRWNLYALVPQAFKVKLHSFPNQSFDFFARVTVMTPGRSGT
jgi:hypothetical protein